MITRLPSAPAKYDQQNENETRRTTELELARVSEELIQAQASIQKILARLAAAGIP